MAKHNSEKSGKYVRLPYATAKEVSAFLFALGNSFVNYKNAETAFDCFKFAIDLDSQNNSAVYNLGALYSIMGNLEGAYRMFKEATRMKPDDTISRVALAEVARKMGNIEEASTILDAVSKADPDNYIVMSSKAILMYDLGRLAEAMDWNERALLKHPGDLHMMLNRALIHMTYGNWAEWWKHYEYCLSYQKNEKMSGLSMADAWSGQELEGQHLLVVSDQGSGDALQFSRYLIEARKMGKFGKLTYLVQPDLKSVLSRVEGIDEVIGFGERLKVDYDAYSSLLGIMRVLQVVPENAHRSPHLTTNGKLDSVWQHKVSEAHDGRSKKVAIVWAGDPRHGNDHARSMPLSQFLKILSGAAVRRDPKRRAIVDLPRKDALKLSLTGLDLALNAPDTIADEFVPPPSNVQLFSFQVGAAAAQLNAAVASDPSASAIAEFGSEFRSFDDTASALRQMDLLITCDTSVAHLAGCLGVPTWVLVPNPPEWRWLTSISVSVWYKDFTIFRQAKPRDWDNVMVAVLRALGEFAR